MSKKDVFGRCPLCGRDNLKLMKSHIIPELVYTRMKTYQNSRFRNYYDFNQIYQDGEKKHMLCHECESFFSKYEVEFANKFFDIYLVTDTHTLPSQTINIKNYILSVAWRILYDDLYIQNSFNNTVMRSTYELFELRLRKYLNLIRTDGVKVCYEADIDESDENAILDTTNLLRNIETYIFTLKDLGYTNEEVSLLDIFILGYTYNTGDQRKFIVLTQYKGLVIAVVFLNYNIIFNLNIVRNYFESDIKSVLKQEMDYNLKRIKSEFAKNQEILDKNDTREKLEKRYENAKKLR